MGNALDVELGRLAQVDLSLGRYSKGDKVKVEHDRMTLQLLQRGHGGFSEAMLEKELLKALIEMVTSSFGILAETGGERTLGSGRKLTRLTLRRERTLGSGRKLTRLTLRRGADLGFCLNPDALTKVGGDDISALRTGDWVRVSEDHGKVQRQQVGHGGWNNDMVTSLGKVGRVAHVFPDRDVNVDVGGRMWRFNPASLTKVSAPGEGGNRLSVGDLVKIDGNAAWVRTMQDGHGGWAPAMSTQAVPTRAA
ncbi:E3 ubiquitin-protein ligase mib1 [Branchiostoma belcheri]|nr:E3 ubiquitin-protein ligase mib1 [Branchiostoma belcheri]